MLEVIKITKAGNGFQIVVLDHTKTWTRFNTTTLMEALQFCKTKDAEVPKPPIATGKDFL